MEENKLYRTGNLISTTVFNRAIEIYKGWDEYVTDNWGEEDDFNKSDYYEEDSCPSIDKIIECVGDEFMWPKMHQYPEDVLGSDYTDEEMDIYDQMTDEDVRRFVNEGIVHFENYIKTATNK